MIFLNSSHKKAEVVKEKNYEIHQNLKTPHIWKTLRKLKSKAFKFERNDVCCINLIQTCPGYIKNSSISIRLKNNLMRRLKTYLSQKDTQLVNRHMRRSSI